MKKILFILLTTFSFATVINIPADYSTIQQGIDASADGDTVLVQAGTYFESLTINIANLTLGSLFLTSGDTSFVSQTVLDGNNLNRCIDIQSDNVKIFGFSIINGFATYSGQSIDGRGAGIRSMGNLPIISNCNFINNSTGSMDDWGGAIYFENGGQVTICSFIDNYAREGGGIFCRFGDLQIHQSYFKNNTSNYFGNDIKTTDVFEVTITSSTFTDNIGTSISNESVDAIFNIIDGAFENCNQALRFPRGTINILDTSFESCGPGYNNVGGAIYCNDCILTIDNSSFNQNESPEGLIYTRGQTVINNSIFWENNFEVAGKTIQSTQSTLGINNCTFFKNGALNLQSLPISIDNSLLNIRNSIGYSLEYPFIGGYNYWYDNIDASYSIIFNVEGDGNISQNPIFLDPDNGNFNLQFESPAIDNGDPDNNGNGITWENDPDDQDPDGTRLDIGAIYFHQTFGCTDPLAFNYNPEATTDNGFCDYIGCTDDLAINYDPQATIDSGDCYYLSDIEQYFQQNWEGIPNNPMGIYLNSAILDEINLRVGDEIAVFDGSECVGMVQLTDEIISPVQIFLSEDDPDTPELDGFVSGGNISYKFWDASEQIEVININSTIFNGSEVFTPLGFSEVELQVNSILGCTEINSINYNPEATINDGTCILTIIGCMDIYACNFDPDANTEGDCLFFDCAQICDGSSYVDDCNVCDDDPLNDNECYGCMDQWALNFDPSFTIPDNSCDYPNIGDISMDGILNVVDLVSLVGVVLDGEFYIEYMDFNLDTFLNIIDIVILVDIILNPETLGCTDINALNYNPDAIYDDGNCDYSDIVIDIHGNVYPTIIIGEQEWMAENLKVSHYNNGSPIANGFNEEDWTHQNDEEIGAFVIYDDESGNAETYGNLYNWYAVENNQGVCPDGWDVPSDEDWMELEMFLGMSESEVNGVGFRGTNEGSKLAGNSNLWYSGSLENNSEFGVSGFNALPSGYRNYTGYEYSAMGFYCHFWSSTSNHSLNSWRRAVGYNNSDLNRSSANKGFGLSIRCIKDSQ
jgi:uncharacterized protein (TIGR02145 family)